MCLRPDAHCEVGRLPRIESELSVRNLASLLIFVACTE